MQSQSEAKEKERERLPPELELNSLRCHRCGLMIPYTFEKGPQYTCPSFTMMGPEAVCYYCYHPLDYEEARKKRAGKK